MNDIFSPCQDLLPDTITLNRSQLQSLIKDLKNNSAPGASGIDKCVLTFLFKYFPNLTTHYFNQLILQPRWESCMENAWLKFRLVIMIPKANKDALNKSNYRPISLLETIYKIISKHFISLVEARAQQDPDFLPPNQYGFVRGRQMNVCSLSIFATIEKLKKSFTPSFLLFLDIASAFDKLLLPVINMAINQIFPNSPLSHAIAAVTHGGITKISANNIVGPRSGFEGGRGSGRPP